jgi:asparagine synthase (glutamine-hydrolysing)
VIPAHIRDEPCLTLTRRDSGVEASGLSHFFRGHRLGDPDQSPDGIFAEWTWDGRRLTVRTDRYGASPLFYTHDSARFSISPSLVRLVEGGAPTEFDEAALAVFLRLGFFLGDDTPFQAIRTVPPDGLLTWEQGTLTVSGGYRMVAPQRIARDAAIDAFIDLFRQSIRRRPPAEQDVVVPLSGGRDSRHILFELCESKQRPAYTVTIPRFPPRASEDERLAPVIAREAGVRHVLLTQTTSRFAAELRKNWDTHLCADEHAWYAEMVDQLAGKARTVYDGLGGALSVPNRFHSREALALLEAGRLRELASALLGAQSRSDEPFLMRVIREPYRNALSFDRAVDHFAAELDRHVAAPDPIKSFNFWNRIRRELALVPYAMMRAVPTVYTPYLDHDLYDFLSSLPIEVMTPPISSSDKSFHTEAVLRGYPHYAHIPFEDRSAPKRDPRAIDAQFGAEAARYLLPRVGVGARLLNASYVMPRLLFGLARRRYRETASWLPAVALYLSQLDAAARRDVASPRAA